MKLIILAFILSLSLHFLLFSPFNKKEEIKQRASTSKKVDKSSIQYVKLMPKLKPKLVEKKKVKKEIVKKVEIKKPKPKKKIYKKVVKKKIIPQKKKRIVKKAKRIVPKPIKKTIEKPTPTKKVAIKAQEKRKTIPKKSLESFLLKDPIPFDRNMLDQVTRNYLKVYGKEYDGFTKVQKVFLQNNLKNFTRITQQVLNRLGYPRLAARLRLSGFNIVEFIFHPDGSISDLKITFKSKHAVFDKHTLELIKYAHKDYPRPKEPTKIKFNVNYKTF